MYSLAIVTKNTYVPTMAKGKIMSADNGVYILKTKRTAREQPRGRLTPGVENFVYRVAMASAIDNLDYYKQKQQYNLGAYMSDVWGRSNVYDNEQDAVMYAHSVAKENYTEYGIKLIDMSEYIFYNDI